MGHPNSSLKMPKYILINVTSLGFVDAATMLHKLIHKIIWTKKEFYCPL